MVSIDPSYMSIFTIKCKNKQYLSVHCQKNSTASLKIAPTCLRRLRVCPTMAKWSKQNVSLFPTSSQKNANVPKLAKEKRSSDFLQNILELQGHHKDYLVVELKKKDKQCRPSSLVQDLVQSKSFHMRWLVNMAINYRLDYQDSFK